MKKIVFFDADGTILDIKRGVPESAKEALRKLTCNGNDAFLCTGRAFSFVPDEVKRMAFTGMIANCGTYIAYRGKVLLDKEMTKEEARLSVKILRENGLIPVMEGTHFMYYDKEEYTDEVDWFAGLITEQLGERWKPIRGNEDKMHIAKISAKVRPGCLEKKACLELSPYYDYVKHEEGMAGGTIEFVKKGFSKGFAIALVCGILGYERKDTVCFGDSNNDISMFEVTDTGVAMGNASPMIIKRAALVTEDMFHDGIYLGLERLGLI